MRSRRRACGASTANVLQTPPSSLLRHLCIEAGAYSAAGHFRAHARRSFLGPACCLPQGRLTQHGSAASCSRAKLLVKSLRRPAPTRRENTTTVQCAANCVRSRTLAAQCGGAVRLRAPGTNASACAISLTHSLPPPPCLLTHRGLLGLLPERSELTCFDTCIRTFHAQQEAGVRSVDIKLEHLHVHPHVGWFTFFFLAQVSFEQVKVSFE